MQPELSKILNNDILLESGTNELEVLVFRVGEYRLGINVAKVREVLDKQVVTEVPQAHPSVVGCFTLRQSVVSCVSLHRHLGQPPVASDSCNLILAEFNQSQTAFMVDQVERIHRIGWKQMLPPPPIVTESEAPITGLTEIGDSLVMMLDFEKIASEIAGANEQIEAVSNPGGVDRTSAHLLVVDDSPTVRKSLYAMLKRSGYQHVTLFEHGLEAWKWVQEKFSETQDWRSVADLVVSDVEMPAMDGLHLTRNIKEHPQLQRIPVVLYSSIATPDNQKKGESVGADAQITKPELSRVVELADSFVGNAAARSEQAVSA